MKAQEFLVKLVQTISPLTHGSKFLKEEGYTPWNITKNLFVPPIGESLSLMRRHAAVLLLPDLLLAQKEVKEWLEGLDEKPPLKTEKASPPEERLDERQGLPEMPEEKNSSKESPLTIAKQILSRKESDSEEQPDRTGAPSIRQEEKTPRLLQKESARFESEKPLAETTRPLQKESARFESEKPLAETTRPQPPSFRRPHSAPSLGKRLPPSARSFTPTPQPIRLTVAQPAQKAIDEVRSAIRCLATSSNLEVPPKLNEVQTALKKIKPFIDQLVQAVEHQVEPEPIRSQSHSFVPTAAPFTSALRLFRSRRKEKKKRDRDKEKESDEH